MLLPANEIGTAQMRQTRLNDGTAKLWLLAPDYMD